MRYRIGGLIFGGAYTWRGLFSEFYGMRTAVSRYEQKLRLPKSITNSRPRPYSIKNGPGIRTFIKNSPQSRNNILTNNDFSSSVVDGQKSGKSFEKGSRNSFFSAWDNSFTAIGHIFRTNKTLIVIYS